jgi:hypothetical protein
MDTLLDATTFHQKLTSLVIFTLTLALLKYFPFIRTAIKRHEQYFSQSAIVVVDGPPSDMKKDLIQSFRLRFKNSQRSFMLVSEADLDRMLLREQLGEAVTYNCEEVEISTRGARYISGLHKSWAALVACGNNLIIDYEFKHDDILTDFFAAFEHSQTRSMLFLKLPGSKLPALPLLKSQLMTHEFDAASIARRLAMLNLI